MSWHACLVSSAKMCSPAVGCNFVKLGAAARDVTLQAGCEKDTAKYEH